MRCGPGGKRTGQPARTVRRSLFSAATAMEREGTHVEAVEDLAVGRVLEEELLEREDAQEELLGPRRKVVRLGVLHRAEVVVADDRLEDLVEPVQRVDPVLHVGPRPLPSRLEERFEQGGQFVLLNVLELLDKLGDARVGRPALLGLSLEPRHARLRLLTGCLLSRFPTRVTVESRGGSESKEEWKGTTRLTGVVGGGRELLVRAACGRMS